MRPRVFAAKNTGTVVLAVPAALLLAFLVLPLIFLGVGTTSADVARAFTSPLVASALGVSLATTLTSTFICVVLGTPLAWLLTRGRGPAARALETLVELPIVVPPAVAGVALLLAFGRQSPLAGWLYPADGSLALTTTAVVLAQVFVAAPLYVLSAKSALAAVDDELLLVARSLGASTLTSLWRVSLPLSRRGLFAGAGMAFARALGEFGATLMFAGNMEGRTQTLPLAIYTALEADLGLARALSLFLIGVAFTLLLLVRFWRSPESARGSAGAP